VELHPLDNEYDSAKAIENARWVIKQRVDFAIEWQRHAKIAPVLAEMSAKASIPALAIDIPQPGALFFEVNNYSTGLMLGEAAGSFVLNEWAGCLDQLLVLEAFAPGLHLHARITGFLDGLQRTVAAPGALRVARRDGKGTEEDGYHVAQRFLHQTNPRLRAPIAAINDPQ
jgi:ribose transport system substrate-binding protein